MSAVSLRMLASGSHTKGQRFDALNRVEVSGCFGHKPGAYLRIAARIPLWTKENAKERKKVRQRRGPSKPSTSLFEYEQPRFHGPLPHIHVK